MIYLLILLPVCDGGGERSPCPAIAGGRGSCRWGHWGTLPWSSRRSSGRRMASRSRAWGAGCCSTRWESSSCCSRAALFFLCSLYAPGYLALRPDRPNRVFCANLFLMLGIMTLGRAVAPSRPDVGGDGSDHAGHRATHLFQSQRPLAGGDLEVPADRVGRASRWPCSVRSSWPTHRSRRGWNRRCSSTSWSRTPRTCRPPGSARPSCSSSSATGPRWAWRRCTPGSRTLTAKRPGLVGTLLAGGVTSCAFLAILRVYAISRAGADAAFAREIMVFMGLLSMAVAAVFMVRQRDFKRMLAYSSVEHMGILVLGVGIGGLAVYGALLHMINNGLTKGVLFLSAGNIHRAYGSKLTDDVQGAIKRVPLSGGLFLAGFLAITGSPPFGPFVSEFTIVSAAAGSGQYITTGLFLLLLGVVFIGMGATVLAVVQGKPAARARNEPVS